MSDKQAACIRIGIKIQANATPIDEQFCLHSICVPEFSFKMNVQFRGELSADWVEQCFVYSVSNTDVFVLK